MDNWKKRVFFKGGVFLSKNEGLNGSRITDVFLKTNDKNDIKNGTEFDRRAVNAKRLFPWPAYKRQHN